MFFEVPQFIDIEDKIAFQLTSKQLGWFALGGLLIFVAWGTLDKGAFILTSIFIALFSSAMSFIRPYGLSMASFISYGLRYSLKPKIYVWQKTADEIKQNDWMEKDQVKRKKELPLAKEGKKTGQKVDELADLLDNIQKI